MVEVEPLAVVELAVSPLLLRQLWKVEVEPVAVVGSASASLVIFLHLSMVQKSSMGVGLAPLSGLHQQLSVSANLYQESVPTDCQALLDRRLAANLCQASKATDRQALLDRQATDCQALLARRVV